MDTAVVIIAIVLLGAVIYVVLKLTNTTRLIEEMKNAPGKDQTALLIKEDLKAIHERMDRQTQNVTGQLQQQSEKSHQILGDLREQLGRLDESQKQVLGFTDQLQRLQDTLNNPKHRGMFGEYQLEQLLAQSFNPKQYQMQYKFKDGEIVDAILYFGDKIIPIDSKFSLENYNRIIAEKDINERQKLEDVFRRDLKTRIDETSKYIRPSEGTLEFAFMFIPAEGIYYDLLVNKVGAVKVNTRDLLDYAIRDKRVHIVSPTTFYVTLQALMVGMNAFKIQESTTSIIKNVGVLGNHVRAYEDYFRKLGNNLNTTVKSFDTASRELAKIDKDVVKISGGEQQIEPLVLEKPNVE